MSPVLKKGESALRASDKGVIKLDERVTEALKNGVSMLAALVLLYYGQNLLRGVLNRLSGEEESAKKVKQALARKLGKMESDISDLNSYEVKMAANILACHELEVTFEDIGGMESELELIRDNVVIPMQYWKMLRDHSDILPCPTGVLLYGKPGTGKTMSAKAIAKEAGASFLNVKASSILDKWLGESDKLATAVFSLARKLAPTVIFIDEIDTLLKNRDSASDTSSAHSSLQGVFLAEWDGLQSQTGAGAPVLVLGASNRIADLDKAILRRLSVTIRTKEPDENGRLDILKKILRTETLAADVDMDSLAQRTGGFTGADLKELVRAAALHRVKAVLSTIYSSGDLSTASSTSGTALTRKEMRNRPLSMADCEAALLRMLTARSESCDFEVNVNNLRREAATDGPSR